MEVTLGNLSSQNPDAHARRGSVGPNYSYANTDKAILAQGVEARRLASERQGDVQPPVEDRAVEDTLELSPDARRLMGSGRPASPQEFGGPGNRGNPASPNSANIDRQAVGTGNADAANGTGIESLGAQDAQAEDGEKTGQPQGSSEDSLELSPEAQQLVESLKARDKEVRAHEAAHLAAGAGIVTGGAQFTTQRGPDGNNYAIGGEVGIDASPVSNNPEATMAKARQIVSAALAPADPSPQDRAVAASAMQMESAASAEMDRNRAEDNRAREKEDRETQERMSPASPQSRQAMNAYGPQADQQAQQSQQAASAIGRAYQTVA